MEIRKNNGYFWFISPCILVVHERGDKMTQRKLIAIATVAALMAIATPAHAQLDAGDRPSTSGPLTTRDRLHDCRSRVERFQGEVAGRFRICYWYFLYDPDSEVGAKNYAGFWAQGTVNPARRWCVRRARLDLDLPAARRVHARAPKPGTMVRTSSSRRYTTRLKVDAQGHATDNGFISNTFRVFANQMRVTRAEGGGIHRMAWSGGTGRTIAFASGVELSYRPGARLPTVNPNLFAFLVRTNTC
jgi:hypothetical protein